jgi:hypothetical protein
LEDKIDIKVEISTERREPAYNLSIFDIENKSKPEVKMTPNIFLVEERLVDG